MKLELLIIIQLFITLMFVFLVYNIKIMHNFKLSLNFNLFILTISLFKLAYLIYAYYSGFTICELSKKLYCC